MKKLSWLAAVTALILCIGCVGAQAEIIPPEGMGQIGYSIAVLCDSLSVRREPRTGAKVVDTITNDSIAIAMEDQDGWTRVVLGDEEGAPSGWVLSDYIIVDPSWYRTEGKTPVYAWDDTSAPKVALLSADKRLPIVKQEGDWLLVSLRGAVGWIHQ